MACCLVQLAAPAASRSCQQAYHTHSSTNRVSGTAHFNRTFPSPPAARGVGKNVTSLIVEARAGKNVRTAKATIVPEPDYRIPIVLLGGAAALVYVDNLLAAAPVGLLGLLLLFQTTRVRFVFDDEALEVKVGEELKESGENVFVGGKNRWKYSTFVNWELWWPNFPVLVYFKETQTKPEGQVHFFPVIFNGKQLYDVMVERAGQSANSLPK